MPIKTFRILVTIHASKIVQFNYDIDEANGSNEVVIISGGYSSSFPIVIYSNMFKMA